MYFYALYKSWLYHKSKNILSALTFFLVSFLVAFLVNIMLSAGDNISVSMREAGANIKISPKNNSLPAILSSNDTRKQMLEADLLEINKIFWSNNITGFAPFLEVRAITRKSIEVDLVGTFFNKHFPLESDADYRTGHKYISKYWQIDGRLPLDTKAELLVGSELARLNNWYKSDIIEISGISFTIVGLLKSGDNLEQKVLAPLSFVQQITNMAGKVHYALVSAITTPDNNLARKASSNINSLSMKEYERFLCTAYVFAVVKQLQDSLFHLNVNSMPRTDTESHFISRIRFILVAVLLLIVIMAIIGINALLCSSVLNRKKEIGLLKSLSASNNSIYIFFYGESVLNALLGSCGGLLFAYLFSYFVLQKVLSGVFVFLWISVPIIILLSLLISFVSSFGAFNMIQKFNIKSIIYD